MKLQQEKRGGVDFRSFRAWRYAPDRVELNRVLAPPYDVISPQEQEGLYASSPFNVVRLILGKESNFYEEASRRWKEWTREGILIQEPRPALYLYEQVFKPPWDSPPLRRLAIVGILKLDESGTVLRHEATFQAPKKDRFLLLEKTQTNLSAVFGLYSDAKQLLSQLRAASQKGSLLFRAEDREGVLHQGWAIEKEEDQKAIQMALARERILIADGHHRYETALEYQKQMRVKFPTAPSEAPFDFVMMALVAFEDEGLLILPTHRILRSFNPSSKKVCLDRLRPHFDLLPTPEEGLFQALKARPQEEKVFGGLFGQEGSFLIRLKGLKTVPVASEIETSLLAHFVFEHLWEISEEKQQDVVDYTRSSEEAIQAVREGRTEAAFLLRPPAIETIRKFAEAGERLPQKTTYFYPKLASGLFFYHQGS